MDRHLKSDDQRAALGRQALQCSADGARGGFGELAAGFNAR